MTNDQAARVLDVLRKENIDAKLDDDNGDNEDIYVEVSGIITADVTTSSNGFARTSSRATRSPSTASARRCWRRAAIPPPRDGTYAREAPTTR